MEEKIEFLGACGYKGEGRISEVDIIVLKFNVGKFYLNFMSAQVLLFEHLPSEKQLILTPLSGLLVNELNVDTFEFKRFEMISFEEVEDGLYKIVFMLPKEISSRLIATYFINFGKEGKICPRFCGGKKIIPSQAGYGNVTYSN